MTKQELRDAVTFKTKFSQSVAAELAMIDQWIYEGYLDVVARTACKVSHGEMDTTVDEWRYELPVAALDILEIWIQGEDDETIDFARVEPRDIIRLRKGLTVDLGSPSRCFAIDGSNFFLVWPTPSAVETLEVLYVPRPAEMSSGTDVPSFIPEEHHKAIEYYCLWQAADADDAASSQKGEYYRSLYEGRDGRGGLLDRIRRAGQRRGGRRLPPVRLAGTLATHSPSADTGW